MQLPTLYRIITSQTTATEPLSEEIAVGICDYIPRQFIFKKCYTIYIQAKMEIAIKTMFWNQFFSKTLLKEIYHHMASRCVLTEQKYANKRNQFFSKIGSSIFKLEDILEWKSSASSKASKELNQCKFMTIQNFEKDASINKISIQVGQYATNKHSDLIFIISEVNPKVKEQMNSDIAYSENKMEKELNSTYKKNRKSNSEYVFSGIKEKENLMLASTKEIRPSSKPKKEGIHSQTNKSISIKSSQMSSINQRHKDTNKSNLKFSLNPLVSYVQESNCNINKSEVKSKKSTKKESHEEQNIENTERTFKDRVSSLLEYPPIQHQKQLRNDQIGKKYDTAVKSSHNNFNFHNNTYNNKEAILSKMLTNKENQAMLLKDELNKKQKQYENGIEQLARQHEIQVFQIQTEVKDVLAQYSNTNLEYRKENQYLQEKVSMLELALEKQHHLYEEKMINWTETEEKYRRSEDKLSDSLIQNKQIKQKLQEGELLWKSEQLRMLEELNKNINKKNQFKDKFESIVEKMKLMVLE